MTQPVVEIRRSKRRRKTMTAYREAGRIVVVVPATLSEGQVDAAIAELVGRLGRRQSRVRSDAAMLARAEELFAQYLAGRTAQTFPGLSVRWVGDMRARWGSCTPDTAAIRISDRVRNLPAYVQDYVLLHELTHLLEPRHGPRFWELLSAYPDLERARSFLDGYTAGAGWEPRDA